MITESITSAQFGASIKAQLRRTGLTTVFFKLGKLLFLLLLPGLLPLAANARPVPVPGATITLNGGLSVNAFSSDNFTVTFIAAQTGLTASNFTVTGTVTGAFVSSVTGSGTSWTVTVSIPGSFQSGGTFTLNLANSTNLSPGLSGLPIAAPSVQVFAYPLDGTLSLSSSNANSGYAKTGDQINSTLQSAHYQLEFWGVNIAGQNASGGPNFNFVATGQVTLGSGTAQGPLAWSWNYTNQFNESASGSGTSGIIFDSVSPTISIGSPSVTTINDGAGSVTYGVTYADANFNTSTLTTSNITLNTTGTATGTIGLTGSGTSYTVTISNISGAGTLGISIASGTASDMAGNLAPASGESTTFNVVNPASPTTTTISSNNNPSFTASPNNSVTFTATVTSFGSPVTQGTVSFTSNGIDISGGTNRPLNGSGTATVNTNFTTAGAYTILATYNGSTDFNPSSSFLTQQANVHPVAISYIAANSAYSNAGTVQFTVNFGASISGLSTNNFSLTTTGAVSGASIASVSPASGSTYTVTVNTGTGDGTIGLNLDNATGLTPGISTSLPFTGGTTTIDRTPPAVNNLSITTSNANPALAYPGDVITIKFTASEPLIFFFGQVNFNSTGQSNSGNDYTLTYTMQNFDSGGPLSIGLNMEDYAGNNYNNVSTSSIVFNPQSPVAVQSITAPNNYNPTNASLVRYNVTFSGPVDNLGGSNFTLGTTGNITGAYITSVQNNRDNTYSVDINTGTGDGSITLSLANANGLSTGVTTTLPFTGDIYHIDKTPPSVSNVSITSNGADPLHAYPGDKITVTFTTNEQIAPPFVLIADYPQTPDASGNNYSESHILQPSDPTGPVEVQGDLQDLAGNVFHWDVTSPIIFSAAGPTTINSITTTDATVTNLGTVHYNIVFANAVTGLSAANFGLSTTGSITGASVTGVFDNGDNSYAVSVNTGAGSGSIALNFVNSNGLSTGVSNTLPMAAGAYTIDKTPPAITALNTTFAGAGSGTAVIGDEVTVAFSSSEDVQTPVVTISGQPATITNLGGNNYQAKYNLQATDPAGNIPVVINLTDLASNTAQSTSAAPFIFNNLPTITVTGILQTPTTFSGTASAPTALTLSLVNNTDLAPATISISGGFELSASPAGPFSNLYTFSPVTANSTQQTYVRLAATAPAGDLSGNLVLALPGAPTISQTISGTALALLSAITPAASISNAPSVIFDVTFSDAVSNVSPANFSLFSYGVSLPSIASVSGSGQNYQVTVNTGSGDGAIGLNLTDASGIHPGVGNAPFTGGTVTIDKTPPSVSNVSITSSNADPLHAYPGDVITVKYTLSEPGPAPVLSIGGKTVNASNTSGTDYTATATIQNDNIAGPLEITGDLQDNAGNVFHWDVISPVIVNLNGPTSVTSVGITDAAVNNLSTVHYHITFAGAITGLSAANFFLDTSSGSITGASVASVDYNGGNSYTVSVNTGQGDGPISLDLANTGGLSTGVTNSLPMPVGTYTIDKTPPAITSFSFTSSNFNPAIAYPGDVVTFYYTTSEPVQNTPFDFGTANEFATGGPTNYSVSHVMTSSDIAGFVKFHTILTDYVNNGLAVTLTSPIVFSVVAPATLTDITLSSGTLSPAFDAATGNYTASVSNATTAITVMPTATDAFATITINGDVVPSGTTSASLPLAVGSNSIVIVVTAQGGITTKTYTLTVTRFSGNANLAGLTLSSGTLSPAFASTITGYTASVGNAITSIQLTPTTSEAHATVQVHGIAVTSGSVSASIPLSVGPNAIYAVVYAQDGTRRTYTVTVTRLSNNANLSNLTASNGLLGPSFISSTVGYTDTVSNATTSLQLSPTTSEAHATVKVNGVAVASGSPSANIPLTVAPTTIYMVVTAADGTQRTYTVKVIRRSNNANLANLTVSTGTISPAFATGTTSYTESVPHATDLISLTPTTSDGNATVKINGTTVASGTASPAFYLQVGDNYFNTKVTAQDGTVKSYTVVVNRPSNGLSINANLSSLTISSGTLKSAFTTAIVNYTDTVSNATTSVAVTPTTSDVNATLRVNGISVTSGSPSGNISLAVGNNAIHTVVLAQDGTQRTYTITVHRLTTGGLNTLYLPGNGKQAPLTASLSEKVEAGNILSPNGDGVNDIWVVKNIAFYPNNTVSVYNKAGQVVFTKKGYANDWDGSYRGSALTEGTYYYLVDLGNGSKIKGFITVVNH